MRFLNCSSVDTTQIPNYVNEYSFFSISNVGNYLNIIQVKVYSISVIFSVRKILFSILFRMKCTHVSVNTPHFEK